MNYQSIIALNIISRTTLIWSIENLKFWNGWTFSQLNRKMITQTDACLEEWGAVCNGFETSGQWLEQQRTFEHKRAVCGTTRSRTDSIFLHQSKKSENHTFSYRHQGSLVLPFENGRNKEQTYDETEQRDQ